MSLRLMTCTTPSDGLAEREKFSNTHILVSQMLQELQLAVGTLGQDRCAERLHDLLDSDGLACELVLCRTAGFVRREVACSRDNCSPDKTECTLRRC